MNKTIGVYSKVSDINFKELPSQFVVKGVHASGYNLIVKDKSTLDKRKTKRLLKKWLRTNQYYRTGQEWAYKNVKPRLIIEPFIKDDSRDSLTDYKFYCFNGIVKFVEVHLDRFSSYACSMYNLNFKRLTLTDVTLGEKRIEKKLKKPANFDEMILLASKLAGRLPFVRVDFYSVKGKTIFGELTFYPADGRKEFTPEKYNTIIGNYFQLPKIPNGKKCITEFDI